MKSWIKTTVLLTTLAMGTTFAQESPRPIPAPGGTLGLPPSTSPALTKFDLDFKGGSPKDLVAAIQKASGKPLNAIVPDELADVKIPALKMKNVDVPQLFKALEGASSKMELTKYNNNYQQTHTVYGFRSNPGTVSDDTIWYFYAEKPS